jgi:hypothetical protein
VICLATLIAIMKKYVNKEIMVHSKMSQKAFVEDAKANQ